MLLIQKTRRNGCHVDCSSLYWPKLNSVLSLSSPVRLCRPVRWKLAWFYCNSEVNLSFVVRPTKGNSFHAEASGPVLPNWETAFEQIGGAESWLDFWSREDGRRREGTTYEGPLLVLLRFKKQRGLLQQSLEVNSSTPADCWQSEWKYKIFVAYCTVFLKKYSPLDTLLLQINSTGFFYKDFKVLITTVITSMRIYLQILSQNFNTLTLRTEKLSLELKDCSLYFSDGETWAGENIKGRGEINLPTTPCCTHLDTKFC